MFGLSPRPFTTLALLGERGLLGEVVLAVQVGEVRGDHVALGVEPGPVPMRSRALTAPAPCVLR